MKSKSVVFLSKRDPLRGKTREEFIDGFRSRLQDRTSIFFGSFALISFHRQGWSFSGNHRFFCITPA